GRSSGIDNGSRLLYLRTSSPMLNVTNSSRASSSLECVAMRVSHLPIGCAPRLTKGLSTYDRIVDHYIREVRDRARDENRWFAIQRTLSDAVEVAAMARSRSGKRLHHQRRIPTPT